MHGLARLPAALGLQSRKHLFRRERQVHHPHAGLVYGVERALRCLVVNDGDPARVGPARLHAIERWRTRLIGDELALGELLDQFPHADAQLLRALIRNVKREAAAKKPPKSFRELFQELRGVIMRPD